MRIPNLDAVIFEEESRLEHYKLETDEVFYRHFCMLYYQAERMSRIEFISLDEFHLMCRQVGRDTHSGYDLYYLIMKHFKWDFHHIVRVNHDGVPTQTVGVQMVEILAAMDELFVATYGVHRWNFNAAAKFRTDNSST